MKRIAFLFFLVLSLAIAQQPVFTRSPVEPTTELTYWKNFVTELAVGLMILMIVLAAVVYVVGQMFGSETRAKTSIWAQNMLAAVGVSAIVLVLLSFVVGMFTGGITFKLIGTPGDPGFIDMLSQLANDSLMLLIFLFLVIAAVVYTIGQMFGAETRARAILWSTGLLSAAIISAVVYVLLFQVLAPLKSTLFPGEDLGLYGGIIIQISFFVAFFILITYMLSKAFKVPEWEAYLSVELSNLMASFFIVLFVLALFASSSIIVIALSGQAVESPPQAAIAYMQGTIASDTLSALMDVYKINACTSILSTFTRRIGEYVLTQTYKVFPGLDTFVSITNVLGFTLVTLYNTITVQIYLLYVVDATMAKLFMPAGLILRFFPPTRDAGAFLISLAFGMQVVFPTAFIFNEMIAKNAGISDNNGVYNSPTVMINSLCGPFKYATAGFLFNPAANPIFKLMPGGMIIGNTLARIFSEGLLNALSMTEFIPIMKAVASISLLGIFMPALAMMVTIAFINAMTKFIVTKV